VNEYFLYLPFVGGKYLRCLTAYCKKYRLSKRNMFWRCDRWNNLYSQKTVLQLCVIKPGKLFSIEKKPQKPDESFLTIFSSHNTGMYTRLSTWNTKRCFLSFVIIQRILMNWKLHQLKSSDFNYVYYMKKNSSFSRRIILYRA